MCASEQTPRRARRRLEGCAFAIGSNVQPTAAVTSLRVLLVDDHPIVRDGLRAVIERARGAVVVAEADNGQDAVSLAREHAPDLVIMDIDMRGLDGIAATLLIKAANSSTRILMLSGLSDADSVLRALQAGASGYLLKECAREDLAAAMKTVIAGETYLSPRISAHVVSGMLAAKAEAAAPLLTERQREILKLIALGNSTKQIAFLLEVSPKTIETHRARIMERLGIRDIAGLVVYAIRARLIDIGVVG